jgi:hypothetical protein
MRMGFERFCCRNALLEADRQLADNQGELAKIWAELGKRSLAAS